MFSRAPRVAHICLRCQRDLARKRPGWLESSPRPSPGARFVRHQSVAAAEPVDDYDDHDPHPSQNHDADPLVDEVPAPEKARENRTRWRKVRRTPTAGLKGIESLGKPSEIILLPSRDRILPESLEYEEGPKQNLSAALESEKAPVNWEQVQEHIELTRRSLDKQRGQLEREEWNDLRLALKRGFSRVQLRKFLKERALRPVNEDVAEEASRPQIAALIATEVWGYTLPRQEQRRPSNPDAQQEETNEPEASATHEYTNAHDLLLLQRDPKYGFQSLTSRLDVSVSIAGSKVTVKGKSAAVEKAKKWLETRTPRLKNIDIDGYGHRYFATDKTKQSLKAHCEKIGTDYDVVLSKHPKGEGVHARYMQANKHAVVAIRRDLRLLSEEKTDPCFMAAARPERIRFAPYFTAAAAPWGTEARNWGRGFDTVAFGSTGMTRRAETSTQLEEQWEEYKKLLDHPLYHTTSEDPNGVRCEISTRFGMNLYQAEAMSKYTGLSIPGQRSWFVDEVPLVAQLLANNHFRDRPSAPIASDVPAGAPLIVRLLLKPVHLSSLAPTIEIYLYGTDPATGLAQPLNVARMTAILDSQSHNVSLPSLPVDISFTRQLKQDLFVQRSPTTPQHPTLLDSIGRYLRKARNSSDQVPEFFFFSDFQIPKELQNLAVSPDQQRGVSNKGTVEYVLSAVETVTTQSRLTPDLGDPEPDARLLLEHRIFTGGRWGPDRQEVRVVQEPLLAASRVRNAGLDNLRVVTLDVAERFGDMARQLRHRMQAVR